MEAVESAEDFESRKVVWLALFNEWKNVTLGMYLWRNVITCAYSDKLNFATGRSRACFSTLRICMCWGNNNRGQDACVTGLVIEFREGVIDGLKKHATVHTRCSHIRVGSNDRQML